MYRKVILLTSTLILLVAVSGSYGIIIGDWENQDDGWQIADGAPEGTTMAYSDTNGVTLNNYSLKFTVPVGTWGNGMCLKLQEYPDLITPFREGGKMRLDVTRLAAEWTGEPGDGHSGIHMVVNAGGDGWSIWDDLGYKGWWKWDQGDNTQTIEWDYTASIPKIDFDNVWWLEIWFISNYDAGYTAGGVYYLDKFEIPVLQQASLPDPANNAVDVPRDVQLSWKAGTDAGQHDVFFGTNPDDIADVNLANLASYPNVTYQRVAAAEFDPGILQLEATYYWRVDEVGAAATVVGEVWNFTVGNYLVVDDFEDYNDYTPDRIFEAWKDGFGFGSPPPAPGPYYAGNGTGSIIGYDTPPFAETSVVHDGAQAMPYFYYNNLPTKMKYSEATLTLTKQRDWTEQGVGALTVWFRGYPAASGAFSSAAGIYTVAGSGTDIWDVPGRDGGFHDEFHFAYQVLNGPGSIVAKVLSVDNTNEWAKAGVMIRNTLDANSIHSIVAVTPSQGVTWQYRLTAGGASINDTQVTEVAAPHWVKLERDISGTVTASHMADGGTWQVMGTPVRITMDIPMYVGLAVTSHDAAKTCEATFSNVTVENGGGAWADLDIGITNNEPEPLYVAIANSDGTSAVVSHPDPNASLTSAWTEWNIPLALFDGVNLTDVNSISLGFGDRDNPAAGGTGTVYFDDIRLFRPECILAERTADFARVDYYPLGTPSGDCIVDARELEVMARDWLVADAFVATQPAGPTGLVAYWPLDSVAGPNTPDLSGNNHTGTLANGAVMISGGYDGTGSAVNIDATDGGKVGIGTWDPSDGTGQLTVSLWMRWGGPHTKSDHQGLVGKRDGWAADGMMWFFEIDTASGALAFRQYSSAATDVYSAGNAMDGFIGKWAHVAATFDGATARIYRNGVEITSGPFAFAPMTDASMAIGNTHGSAGWDGSTEVFKGDIDEVRLYSRPLTAGEIAYLADTTPGDGQLYVPVASSAELSAAEDQGSRRVNFYDFVVLADWWLDTQLWPWQ